MTWRRQQVLSTRSRRIIARGNGHRVQIDRPDVIVSAVEEMILQLRGTSAPPTGYSTTVTLTGCYKPFANAVKLCSWWIELGYWPGSSSRVQLQI